MSVPFDPTISTSANQGIPQGYRDDPRAETDPLAGPGDLDENPLPAGATSSEGVSPILAAIGPDRDNAIPIDGSSTNQPQRTQGRTPDGKTIQIDPLHQGEQVSIARERTLASAGFGQTYVSSDQLVLTTGAGNDDVQVTQRDDGTLDVDVNGESFEVRMAQGQELTIRSGATPTVINVELGTTRGVTIEGSEAFRQRVGAEIEFLRSSPSGQQMLAEFDATAANGNTVTIRELANEQNGYAQTLGRGNAEIGNGRAGEGSDVVISYNPSFHMAAFPAPLVVLFHEMSHAYNGVNGTFQPGTCRGTGPDSGRVPNAERQAVGLPAPLFSVHGGDVAPSHRALPLPLLASTVPPLPLAARVEPGDTLQGGFEYASLTAQSPRRLRWCLGVAPFVQEDFRKLEPGTGQARTVWQASFAVAECQQLLCTPWYEVASGGFARNGA